MTKARLWIVSELFYPEETSTGYFLTKIAEGLALKWDVAAVAAQPTYSERGIIAPRRESYRGMTIHRVFSTRFNKDNLPLRLVNVLSFTLSVLFFALTQFKRGDHVLLVTNPPFLMPVIALAGKIRGTRSWLLVHDVYPEVLAATGTVKRGGLIYRAVGAVLRPAMSRFEKIIVLGRDMQQLIAASARRPVADVPIIPNWADVEEIQPICPAENPFVREFDLARRVCIQFSGNIGRTHDLQAVLDTAKHFRDDPEVVFMIIGYGGQADRIHDEIKQGGGGNIVFLGRQPRERLAAMLACPTATVIPFNSGMKGISVPSRMYNIMAAGTPIIALADPDSELAMTVTENDAGWALETGDVAGLIALVASLKTVSGRMARDEKSANATAAVMEKYRLATVINQFEVCLRG